jgi:hypothetical protein
MPMRQLRTCDFCDGEAAGIYEVVPPELSPTEAEQRRVVLCDDCLDTLEAVLTPLLSRLGVEPDESEHRAGRRDAPADNPVRSGSDVDPTDSFADDDPRGTSMSEGAGRIPDVGSGHDDGSEERASGEWEGPDGDPDAESDDSDQATGSPANGRTRSAVEEPAGIDGDRSGDGPPGSPGREAGGGPSEDRVDAPAAERDSGEADSVTPADSDDADGVTPAAPDDASDETPAAPDDADEPEDFRTVMRLLGNREFPVERYELVELATSAYDIEASHVDEIIAYAVERDLLEDDGEKLYRV